jgi:hypothetical protein
VSRRKHSAASSPELRGTKTVLLEAAEAAINEQRNKPRSSGQTAGAATRRTVLGGLTVLAAAVLLIQPAWLTGPKFEAESPEIKAATATMVLIDAASRVKAYQAVTGRLPWRLQDIGFDNPAVQYQLADSTRFVVSLLVGDSTIVIRSTDSIRPLAMKAIRVLQARS